MLKKREALKILEVNFRHEEQIMIDLAQYLLVLVEKSSDFSKREVEDLKRGLSILREDTENHAKTFEELFKYVSGSKKNDF